MDGKELLKIAGYGALAGVAGTVAIQMARTANQKLLPKTVPPISGDPGEYVIKTLESLLPEDVRERIPKSIEAAGSAFLSFGYGSTGAALYTALRSDPNVLLDGAALGTAVWAAGYLGWLPALGWMPGVHRQKPSQVASSVLQHILYGVATVTAYRKLRASLEAA